MSRKIYLPIDLTNELMNLKPCQIGGYIFGVNPISFQMQVQRNAYDIPTKSGAFRNSYGVLWTTFTITGFLSNGGVRELSDMQQNIQLKFGNNREKSYPLTYPIMGIHAQQIFIDQETISINQDMPFNLQYEIVAKGYGSNGASTTTPTLLTGTPSSGPSASVVNSR